MKKKKNYLESVYCKLQKYNKNVWYYRECIEYFSLWRDKFEKIEYYILNVRFEILKVQYVCSFVGWKWKILEFPPSNHIALKEYIHFTYVFIYNIKYSMKINTAPSKHDIVGIYITTSVHWKVPNNSKYYLLFHCFHKRIEYLCLIYVLNLSKCSFRLIYQILCYWPYKVDF